jgi:hypothetical protein
MTPGRCLVAALVAALVAKSGAALEFLALHHQGACKHSPEFTENIASSST